MSVIAKLYVQENRNYGAGSLTQMNCVCENDMMAAYAGSEEDKLFTQYSPQGDVKIHHDAGWVPIGEQGDKFYFMILSDDEVEDATFPSAIAYRKLMVHSVTDFGFDSRRLDMREAGNPEGDWPGKRISRFSWTMTVDNPALMNGGFFKAGSAKYWLAIYPASDFTRDTAIAAAHGRG